MEESGKTSGRKGLAQSIKKLKNLSLADEGKPPEATLSPVQMQGLERMSEES